MQFQNPGLDITTFAILLAIVCLFAIMLRRRRRRPTLLERPPRDVAYEWLAEPLLKASANFRGKFSGLDDLPQTDEIQLIRLGVFNLGTEPVEPAEFEVPISISFEPTATLLVASVGETHRTAAIDPGSVTLEGSNVRIAPFNIAAGGTVIFNIIARSGAPHSVTGSIANFGSLRRLS
jgi:hypothetical protein